MGQVVITVIGDDRAGLVDRLSGVVTDCGGNWERSHLAELAGKFAGVVVVSVPDGRLTELDAGLDAIETAGLLHISSERAEHHDPEQRPRRLQLKLIGQDHQGIVHEISHALAGMDVSIEELQTSVVPAPMGGSLFEARAILNAPTGSDVDRMAYVLETISPELMIDIETAEEPVP